MADNIVVLDGAGASKEIAAKDISNVLYHKHILYNQYGEPILIDDISNSQVVVNLTENMRHEEKSFRVNVFDEDLDSTNELIIAFQISNTTLLKHVKIKASNTVGAKFEILEAPTITGGTGTQIDTYNQTRDSSDVSTIEDIDDVSAHMTKNPTITADGTAIYTKLISLGIECISEWILKTNTQYALRITGNADNGLANIEMDWFEHASIR